MTNRAHLLAAGFGALLICSPAVAADTATDFNIYTLKNFTSTGGSVEGRVAVGGNASISNMSVATTAANGQTDLAVGGNLSTSGGTLNHGNIQAGGTVSGSITVQNGTTTANSSPFNFTAENARLQSLSSTLAGYANTGTVTNYYGQLQLTGTSSGLNVFTINGADLTSSSTWGLSINAPTGSQVLINVTGATDTFHQSISLSGISSTMVLYNFYEATTLNIQNMDVLGTILATSANTTTSGGNIRGDILVSALTTSNTGYFANGYQGTLLNNVSPVPEPASWLMMIGGFGLIGATMRRKAARGRIATPQL